MGSIHITAPAFIDTARRLVGDGKGLLAMDESNPTCNKHFATLGIPQNHRGTARVARTHYPLALADSISGAILYDETIHQSCSDGTPFVKVLADAGSVALPVDERVWGRNGCQRLRRDGFFLPTHKTGGQKTA